MQLAASAHKHLGGIPLCILCYQLQRYALRLLLVYSDRGFGCTTRTGVGLLRWCCMLQLSSNPPEQS